MIPKQPATGIVATGLVIAVSFAFISLWDFQQFSGWILYGLLCVIPMEIIVGVLWETKYPRFAQRPQPVKGILLALVIGAAGVAVGLVYYEVAGGGINPPAPMLIQCAIVSVIVTFWWAIMMGGWPFTAWTGNRLAAGLGVWAGCYVLNYILFRIFFNYSAMQGAPVYSAVLDPGGLFDADHALVFYMSVITIMFLMLHFDLWPLTRFPGILRQPVMGTVWTAMAFLFGGGLFYLGVYGIGMDVNRFLVRVPVPFIFGTIVVLNMCQNSYFPGLKQPARGAANAISAAIIGTGLSALYRAVMPVLTGPLSSGPPGYDAERWIASALLGVTFPLLVLHADFFGFWPLRKQQAPEKTRTASTPG